MMFPFFSFLSLVLCISHEGWEYSPPAWVGFLLMHEYLEQIIFKKILIKQENFFLLPCSYSSVLSLNL